MSTELQDILQQLSGVNLDAQGCANALAGTSGLDLIGALNAWAGTSGLELAAAIRAATGSSGDPAGALADYLAGGGGGGGGDSLTALIVPGTAGNYASTPDSAAIGAIVGDIDIRVHLTLDDWTNIDQNFVANRGGVGGWRFRTHASGPSRLQWNWRVDDTTQKFVNTTDAVWTPPAAGTAKWLRVTMDADDGADNHIVTFYDSDDGAAWNQIEQKSGAGATSIGDDNDPLEVGSDGGGASPMAGRVHYAEVRDGIDGTVVVVFDPENDASLTAQQLPTSFEAATGETWTLNGTDWAWMSPWATPATGIVFPGVTGNHLESADSAAWSVTGDIDIRVKMTAPTWAADHIFIDKWDTGQQAYQFYIDSSDQLVFLVSTTGSNQLGIVSTVTTGFADGTTHWVRATRTSADGIVTYYTSDDGETWDQLGDTVSPTSGDINDSTASVYLGDMHGGFVPSDATVHYVEVRSGIDGPVVGYFDPALIPVAGTRDPTSAIAGGPWTTNGILWDWETA